jgi:hypothetical protein
MWAGLSLRHLLRNHDTVGSEILSLRVVRRSSFGRLPRYRYTTREGGPDVNRPDGYSDDRTTADGRAMARPGGRFGRVRRQIAICQTFLV